MCMSDFTHTKIVLYVFALPLTLTGCRVSCIFIYIDSSFEPLSHQTDYTYIEKPQNSFPFCTLLVQNQKKLSYTAHREHLLGDKNRFVYFDVEMRKIKIQANLLPDDNNKTTSEERKT